MIGTFSLLAKKEKKIDLEKGVGKVRQSEFPANDFNLTRTLAT